MCVIIMNDNLVNGQRDLGATLKRYPFSMILAILSVPAFIFVFAMLLFHTQLNLRNLTTKEYLDEKY